MSVAKPITTAALRKMKREGVPIAMITAYDYPSAIFAEQAGADVLLVGDSLANVVLGYDSTIPVTLDDMIHHTKSVTRAAKRSLVVTDLPFLTYNGSVDTTLRNAGRIMQEGLAKAVKMEGGESIIDAVEACTKAGIPVMGHLGFTPQSVHQIGGFFVQGKTASKANQMIEDAKRLEQAGVFSIVLELVPSELSSIITEQLSIPTIGIGAGPHCDGQVLVFHDLLQYGPENRKKFVKTYANVGDTIRDGIAAYVKDVKSRTFPDHRHSFEVEEGTLDHLYGGKADESDSNH